MANQEQLDRLLSGGVESWNNWRKENQDIYIDLCGANLRGINLAGVNFSYKPEHPAYHNRLHHPEGDTYPFDPDLSVNLRGANLTEANLSQADLSWANLNGAHLQGAILTQSNLVGSVLVRANLSTANLSNAVLSPANLTEANLGGAILNGANLCEAHLPGANLRGAKLNEAKLVHIQLSSASLWRADLNQADLTKANLSYTTLILANLTKADLSKAILDWANLSWADCTDTHFTQARVIGTTFGHVDLSVAKGLATVEHYGPSFIDIHTLYQSKGDIPDQFLEEVGIPLDFIKDIKPQLLLQENYLTAQLSSLQKQLMYVTTRKDKFKEQIAFKGMSVDPSISMEVEELEKEEANLKTQIEDIRLQLSQVNK